MNLANRLKERMKQEGVLKTIQYAGSATYDTLRCLARDAAIDLKFSGRLLDNRKSRYPHLGANDVYHSDYDALKLIFNYCCPVMEKDVLVDVGCGKGRVINYWLSQGYSNPIIGLELDPAIAAQTAAQFSHRSNVKILEGDAIRNLPRDGTLFYFYNPFAENKVREFEQRLHKISQNTPTTVVYYNPKSLPAFRNNQWRIEQLNFEQDLGVRRWGRINKFHDLAIIRNY
jgi:SAM-dependent methyltransferase